MPKVKTETKNMEDLQDEVIQEETTEETQEELSEDFLEEAPEEALGDVDNISEEEEEDTPKKKASKKKESEPVVLTPDEDLADRVSPGSSKIMQATKKKRKELYQAEKVITENGEIEPVTDADVIRADLLELIASAKSNKILEGEIIGFHYSGQEKKSTVVADIQFGNGFFKIFIPSYLLFDHEVSDYVDSKKIQVIENHVRRMLGTKIKFLVRQVDEAAMTAYGDRLTAQSIIGYDNYFRPQKDGMPRIQPEMLVQAQVTYVISKYITVEALGCDITIRREDLSYLYVGDAREEYKPGDKITVRIKSVDRVKKDKNGTIIDMVVATASGKEASIDKRRRFFDNYKEGSIYKAEVTYVEERGVFCRIGGVIDCLCAPPRYGEIPTRGESRVIEITQKNEEELRLFGIFKTV